MSDHTQITDPKYRRLRKALRRAEDFMFATKMRSPVAIGRWNKIRQRAIRLGAMRP